MGRWMQVDPKAEMAGYPYSPYSWPMNNPISYNDPQGDIAPLVAIGLVAIGGGAVNVVSNWKNIGSFMEGLNYFAVGAGGYGVSTVNPLAGGAILSGGNLLIKGVYGDLPTINGIGDFAGAATEVVFDFAGPYTIGSTMSTSWTKFQPTGTLSKAELAQYAKDGITPSIKEVAGTGLRRKVTEEVVKNTTVQTANQITKHSSKTLAQNLINAGFQRPLNTAAHHIVAGGSSNRYAQLSRDILNRAGIGIDDATNGVFLPKNLSYANPPALTHSTIHTNLYYKNIYSRISRVPLNQVGKQLDVIRNQLLQGTFPF